MQQLLERNALQHLIEVDSAGTYGGHAGERSDPRMRRAAAARGIEMTHLARRVREEDFEIFDRIAITQHVIITTAYDNYAINAFKVNSVDYLLKPIVEEDMKRAWSRCKERLESRLTSDMERLMNIMSRANVANSKEYKKRFTVKTGEKISIIPVDEIAYCYSKDKSTYAVNRNGSQRLLDYSLDMVQEMLDPKIFFRISRSYIVSINAIENISKYLSTRLKLQLTPPTDDEVVVSRSRTADFLEWLDNN